MPSLSHSQGVGLLNMIMSTQVILNGVYCYTFAYGYFDQGDFFWYQRFFFLQSFSHVWLFLVIMYCAWKDKYYKGENIKANVCLHALNHEPILSPEKDKEKFKPKSLRKKGSRSKYVNDVI